MIRPKTQEINRKRYSHICSDKFIVSNFKILITSTHPPSLSYTPLFYVFNFTFSLPLTISPLTISPFTTLKSSLLSLPQRLTAHSNACALSTARVYLQCQ